MPRLLVALLVPIVAMAAAVPVIGATPRGMQAGQTLHWTGEAPGLGVVGENDRLVAAGEAPGCDPVTCSLREVEVGERGDLYVTAVDGAGEVEVDVFLPGGGFVARVGMKGAPTTVHVPRAEPGTYLVQVTTSQSLDRGGAFAASAFLR